MSALSRALFPICLLVVSCSSSPSGQDIDQGPITSDSGALVVTVTSEPEAQPVRGLNQLFFEIQSQETRQPVDELELEMTPLMPSHAHSSPHVPPATPLGGGRYRFDDVVLSMPGLWEFRTTIAGAAEDHVTPRFEVE